MNHKKRISKKAIEWIKNIKKSRYRIRILISFFAVAVLAIGFIDVAVFRGLFISIREESNQETIEVLENINSSYENQIEQYQSGAQMLFRNYNIKAFLVTKGKEDSHIDSIYEAMRAAAGNMTGVSSILLFHKKEILASFDTGAVTLTAKEELIQKLNQTDSDRELFFIYPNAHKYQKQMVLFRTERESLYGPSIYGVAMVINPDEIQKRVLPRNREAENPIYIMHQNGEIIANQNDEYKDILPDISKDIISGSLSQDSFYKIIEGEKRAVSYMWSADKRFLSIRIQEFASSQEKVYAALRTILFSTIFVMGFITVLVWLISGWIYQPLDKIFKGIFEIAHAEAVTTNGKDELVMATDALQDVNYNMNLLKSQIRSNAVVRFLRQGATDHFLTNHMFEFGACQPNHFIIVVFRYYMEEWSYNDAVMKYLGEVAFPKSANNDGGEHIYNAEQGELVILHYENKSQTSQPEQLRDALEQALMNLHVTYNANGCIGISQSSDLNKLPEAYRRAMLMTEYYIFSKELMVIDDETHALKKQGNITEPEREIILQLVKGIGDGDIPEHVSKLMHNLNAYHIGNAQKYLKQLVADVIRLSETISVEKNEQYEMYLEDFFTNPMFLGPVNIDEWLSQLFLEVQKLLEEGKKDTISRIMEEILEYINLNYTKCTLSVEEMADLYGWSVSYFSKNFNNYTGQPFPFYVNQLRLQKARELLLKDTHSSVQEIALQVGFNSSSYFSAAFRKHYGITPSLMRKIGNK
jgi:AraC-like DNA-binding protein